MGNYKILRWGILGAGTIAEFFVEALSVLDDHVVTAVASRDIMKSEKFIQTNNLKSATALGSYIEMGEFENVDIVYVATINPLHLDCVSLMLEAGKHVLCEKPISMNISETKTMVDIAREKNLFLMEGVWSRFHPINIKVNSWIKDGRIGKVNRFEASQGLFGGEDKENRILNKSLGGGSLLDVGVYPLSMAQFFLSKSPIYTIGVASIDPITGVDRHFSAISYYGDDLIAVCSGSVIQKLDNTARILGSKGMVVIPNYIHPNEAHLYDLGENEEDEPVLIETYSCSDLKNGFEFEAMGVKEALNNGQLESDIMPLGDSILVSSQITKLLNDWDIKY